MCCFSKPIRHVSATRIFACALPNGRQRLVYSAKLDVEEDLAMVLPLAVPDGTGEDGVQFLDLSDAPQFFDHVDALFPSDRPPSRGGASRSLNATLTVHSVGAYEASYVPSANDFRRLDERFRLPEPALDALKRYRTASGFAVFKLRAHEKEIARNPFRSFAKRLLGSKESVGPRSSAKALHPLALEMPRADPARLFFPTLHVHDGTLHAEAKFDHQLFAQLAQGDEPLGWVRAAEKTEALPASTRRWLRDDSPLFKLTLRGQKPNEDVFV